MDTIFSYSKEGTPVFLTEGGHPHLINAKAKRAILNMDIPAVPENVNDFTKTRICKTVDFGQIVGFNHRVKMEPGDIDFYIDRGIDKPRGYESHMVLKFPKPETKITTVVVWFNNQWNILTNFCGEEDPFVEPGTERWKRLDVKDQVISIKWFRENPLSPTKAEIKKAIKVYSQLIDEETDELEELDGAIPSLEWNARDRVLQNMMKILSAMKEFQEDMRYFDGM